VRTKELDGSDLDITPSPRVDRAHKAVDQKSPMIPSFLWDALPSRIRRSLASSAVRSLERTRDFAVHDWLSISSLNRSLAQLASAGWHARHVIDVGAHEGDWTLSLLSAFPGAHCLMVEALPHKREHLARICRLHRNCRMAIVLLGSEEQPSVMFNVAETGSSLLPDAGDSTSEQLALAMTTLDTLVNEQAYPSVDLLKIDVQGAELLVLQGATHTLSTTEIVLLELSLQQLYATAPLAAEVIAFMDRSGFKLYDVCSLIRRPRDHALAQIDAMFVRHDSPLGQHISWT